MANMSPPTTFLVKLMLGKLSVALGVELLSCSLTLRLFFFFGGAFTVLWSLVYWSKPCLNTEMRSGTDLELSDFAPSIAVTSLFRFRFLRFLPGAGGSKWR